MRPHHDTTTPDIETASDAYAQRFAGPTGQYFLEVQQQLVERLLAGGMPQRILELGGGHAQIAPGLLAAGHELWVQSSAPVCARRLEVLRAQHPGRLHLVVSSFWSLPFPDGAFDAVVAVRLLAHVDRVEALLTEMARVSRRAVLVDFPPRISANLLAPAMFPLKRQLEGNTRPFFCYHSRELVGPLRTAGFRHMRVTKQFFLPMVLHRALKNRAVSTLLEGASRRLGLTALLGAPSFLLAERGEVGR